MNFSVSYSPEMILKKVHDIIPFRQLLKLLIGLSASIQLLVILYNHVSGFFILEGILHFLTRWLWGTALSLIATFLIAYPDLLIIRWLNRTFSWNRNLVARLIIQLGLAVSLALIVAVLITALSHVLTSYREGLLTAITTNIQIFAAFNILMMVVLEAWIFFIEGYKSRKKSEILEKELSQIRFEVLKNQINPHFMFNSLNVLSGLIETDQKKAQQFIEEFSQIYRYVLETIEQQVVTLNQELDFARSYMFLQQIRYGEFLHFRVNVPSELLDRYLPPLSLQIVLENAIKHNQISASMPLELELVGENDFLYFRNNVQLKISAGSSTGIGQKNLLRRYKMISERVPTFEMGASQYVVKLPLIEEE